MMTITETTAGSSTCAYVCVELEKADEERAGKRWLALFSMSDSKKWKACFSPDIFRFIISLHGAEAV